MRTVETALGVAGLDGLSGLFKVANGAEGMDFGGRKSGKIEVDDINIASKVSI